MPVAVTGVKRGHVAVVTLWLCPRCENGVAVTDVKNSVVLSLVCKVNISVKKGLMASLVGRE